MRGKLAKALRRQAQGQTKGAPAAGYTARSTVGRSTQPKGGQPRGEFVVRVAPGTTRAYYRALKRAMREARRGDN